MYRNIKGSLKIVDVGSVHFKSLDELEDTYKVLMEKFK